MLLLAVTEVIILASLMSWLLNVWLGDAFANDANVILCLSSFTSGLELIMPNLIGSYG